MSEFEDRLGHRFSKPELLARALVHSSAAKRGDRGNERLEFLGDRVLGLIVAERLVERFAGEAEGQLARRQAHLVDETTLAGVATSLDLGRFLTLAKGDEGSGNRQNQGVLADALEAVIAALYLDAGLERVRRFVLTHWQALIDSPVEAPRDAKSSLQEWAMARGLDLPHYRVIRHDGPAHRPVFEIAVEVKGMEPVSAEGSSKRLAEHGAAAKLLEQLNRQA